jgi:hypothetical protein
MSAVETPAEPRTEGLESHEIYPEAAFVGLRPIELRRDDGHDGQAVLQRVRRVGGIRSAQLASPDDDPTGGWRDDDQVGVGRITGGDIEVWALLVTLGLVAFFWDVYHASVIDVSNLDGTTPLPDGDLIKLENKPGTPGFLQITLRAAPTVTWWKDIEFRDSKTVTRATAWTPSATSPRHSSRPAPPLGAIVRSSRSLRSS